MRSGLNGAESHVVECKTAIGIMPYLLCTTADVLDGLRPACSESADWDSCIIGLGRCKPSRPERSCIEHR